MSDTAYAVLVIHKQSRIVRGLSVFSEPTPSLGAELYSVVLFHISSNTYELAQRAVYEQIDKDPQLAWLRPVTEWKRGRLGRPGESESTFPGDLWPRIRSLEQRVARIENHWTGFHK